MPGHEDMNALIRRAAGYPPVEAQAPPARAPKPVGDLGIGRGGSAMERRPRRAPTRPEQDVERPEAFINQTLDTARLVSSRAT
jgi:hypothetical protein